jgi:hypothetical protein
MHGMRAAATGLAVLLSNCVLFLGAFFLGLRVIYPLLFNVLGRGSVGYGRSLVSEGMLILLSVASADLLAGGVPTLWSRHVWSVALAGGVTYLLGRSVLSEAMYLADGGDSSMMWQYVRPHPRELLESIAAVLSAAGGWYTARAARPKGHTTAAGTGNDSEARGRRTRG